MLKGRSSRWYASTSPSTRSRPGCSGRPMRTPWADVLSVSGIDPHAASRITADLGMGRVRNVRVGPPTPNECSLGRAKGWPRGPSVEGRSSLSRGPSRPSSHVKIERVGERRVRGGSPARAEPDAGSVQAACGDGDLVAEASQRVDVAASPGSGVAAFEVVPAEFVVGHVVGCQMITMRAWATAKIALPSFFLPIWHELLVSTSTSPANPARSHSRSLSSLRPSRRRPPASGTLELKSSRRYAWSEFRGSTGGHTRGGLPMGCAGHSPRGTSAVRRRPG